MTEVINETDYEINEAEFSALADYVLDQMHVSSDAEVNIIFIEPEPMEDVMSFPMDELRPGTADHPTPPGMLGDICICPQVAARQAAESGHSAAEEMLLLATHGMLHLLGYDHATDPEREVMFALQRKLLLTFLATR